MKRLAARGTWVLILAALFLPMAEAESGRDVMLRPEILRLPVEDAKGLRFHRLSTADGLSQTRVAQIIQDDRGFIWFGTQYGLNRFDGYDFKLFVHEPGNEKSAAGTWVFSLFKDRDGLIWVGWSEGLDRFDPRTETFTHYRVEPNEPEEGSRVASTIMHISQDRDGMLWLSTGSGLHRFDPATGEVAHHRHGSDADGLPTNDINWSGGDSHGRFWVGTSVGLLEFDRTRGKVSRHIQVPDSVQVTLFEDRAGQFWITQASGNGLTRYDPDSNTLTPYSIYENDPGSTALTGIMGIAGDADGNLWLGSPGHGLLRLNRERNRFYHYRYQPNRLTMQPCGQHSA